MSKPIVLLIEDDNAVRETLVRILERAGLHILPACSGDEAVKIASHTFPDVIVTDFNMPGMNGVEAVRALRRTTTLFHLPALIISGRPIPEVAESVERLGMARLIPKPFLFADLIQSIRNLCDQDAPVTVTSST
ncbi:MAG TPA: response regulator [Candidatus Acidoferrum sp.]|nr:response regulator [Candidatus Acidoferrum sp.]